MFKKRFPFNQMTTEEIDGVKYKFLPNIWIRNEKLPAGATYEDYMAYMINDKPKSGYHIATSFVTNSKVNDNGLLIGEDIIVGNFAYNELKSKAAEYNAEPFNIHDMHLV